MTARRFVILALAAGLVFGVVVALAVPKTSKPEKPRIGRPWPIHYVPGEIRVRVMPGSVHELVRADDPDGGPPWVVHTYRSRFVPPSSPKGIKYGRDIKGIHFCAQLGRIVDGNFGWIDADNFFRPTPLGFHEGPTMCDDREPGAGRRPIFEAENLIAGLSSGEPYFTRSVIWGTAGPGTTAVHMTGGDAHVGMRGGFIRFEGPDLDHLAVRGRFAWGTRFKTFQLVPDLPRELPGPRPGRGERRVVQARTPDPSGGLAWGVAAVHSTSGDWCIGQGGRVVGNRVGYVNFRLGTFREEQWLLQCPPRNYENPNYLRHHPLLSVQWGGGAEPDPDSGESNRGRIARRTQAGLTTIEGRARADVVSITVASPRDVRTIQPTGPAHAFLLVYDGDFPTGSVVLTAHLRDGRSIKAETLTFGDL